MATNRVVGNGAVAICTIVAALIFFFGSAIYSVCASSLILFVIILRLMSIRRSIVDSHFLFAFFFLIFQVVNPLLYTAEVVWVGEGGFLVDNWALLAKGNFYSLLALGCYCLGIYVVRFSKLKNAAVEWKALVSAKECGSLITFWYALAFVSWVVIFVKLGMPTETLMGLPPEGRERTMWEQGGYGYFLELTFGASIVPILYMLRNPKHRLLSFRYVFMIAAIYFLNGIRGSRQILVMAPVSIFMMREIVRLGVARRSFFQPFSWLTKRLFIVVGVSFTVAAGVAYGFYRTGFDSSLTFDLEMGIFLLVNMFDTSLTYFMVLDKVPLEIDYWLGKSFAVPFILRIPSFIFAEKYDYLWGAQKFTLYFYGYDQNQIGTVARGMSLMAELFLNFGALGIAFAMIALGFLNEKLSRRIFESRTTGVFKISYVLYLAYFLPFAFKSGLSEAVTYFDIKFLTFIIPVILAEALYSKNYGRQSGH